MRKVLVLMLSCLAQATQAGEQGPLAHFAHLVGGEWIAEQPQQFSDERRFVPVLRYEWIYENQALRAVMTYRYDDGEAREAFEAITAWDPARKAAVHYSTWANGLFIVGEYEAPRDGQPVRLNFEVSWPDADNPGPRRWRSEELHLPDGRLRERAWAMSGEQWVLRSDLTYRRAR